MNFICVVILYSCLCICVCGCWMTVCQGSTHTHMAGGQDIPARARQDLIPLVSLGAVASGHAAQAQNHRLSLRSPASHRLLPSAKRYFYTFVSHPFVFNDRSLIWPARPEVILRWRYRWWRVEEEALGGVRGVWGMWVRGGEGLQATGNLEFQCHVNMWSLPGLSMYRIQ